MIAYGVTHVPTEPGMHKKGVRMFSPIEEGTLWDYFGYSRVGKGIPLQLTNPEAIAAGESRFLSRVKASGKVFLTMQVTQRNLGRHGYVVSS